MLPRAWFSCRLFLPLAVYALLPLTAATQDRLSELQSAFMREPEAVKKAKVLEKLGDAQFAEMRGKINAGNFAGALKMVQEYRDEARSVEAALKARGVDPERKPAGFKQLQIHLRKSIRDLEQTILVLPESERSGFESVRGDLLRMETELIELLFPRQPGKGDREKPKG